jgi:FtsP/CotA-like multicopper oxidase with cupredoxin domain
MGQANWTVPLRQAGTRLLDLRLLTDPASPPLPVAAMVVEEDGPAIADRDEILLIEEVRLGRDAKPVAPGALPGQAPAIFTVNGQATADIAIRPNERLRLRLVNGSHRAIVALKIDGHDVTVIAIDGQPAEPFPARGGELILAPAARIDVLLDGTARASGTATNILLHDGTAPRPVARLVYGATPLRNAALAPAGALPSNGLPERLDLQGAHRVELAFDGKASASWLMPAELGASAPPVFSAKRGRVIVATLVNRAPAPAIFHLHGHHARLLDRLDDGWKPFWLDTVTVGAGQTQRIAFLADTEGAWLIDAMATAWMAPRVARWFKVEA